MNTTFGSEAIDEPNAETMQTAEETTETRRELHSRYGSGGVVVSDDTNTVLLLVPVVIVLLVSAAVPAYLVWLTAPPVGGEFFPYVRLGAAMITAIIGAFLGAYILQSSVSIVRSLGSDE